MRYWRIAPDSKTRTEVPLARVSVIAGMRPFGLICWTYHGLLSCQNTPDLAQPIAASAVFRSHSRLLLLLFHVNIVHFVWQAELSEKDGDLDSVGRLSGVESNGWLYIGVTAMWANGRNIYSRRCHFCFSRFLDFDPGLNGLDAV